MAWFDDVGLSGVKSISFSSKEKVAVKPPELGNEDKRLEDSELFACSDFLVADESALIC